MTMTSPLTFPYRLPMEADTITSLLFKGSVWTLLGQVQRIDLGWPGRLRVRLRLSVGELNIVGNRESIPLDAKEGEWLRVKVRRSYAVPQRNEPELRVLAARVVEPDLPSAWLPTARCHRMAHLLRLRKLLHTLHPVAQLLFMLALADARVQRAFFWRAAAADHNVYPGGLLDESVDAAVRVAGRGFASNVDRNVATLAALLFDLGKVEERVLKRDRPRCALLTPHPLTGGLVRRALDTVEHLHPALVGKIRALL
jgi:hypothetical protein